MQLKLVQAIKYWSQALLLPIYGASHLFPRSERIWAFGSSFGKRFADNPKYLYLYATHQTEYPITPIWITHEKEIVNMLNDIDLKAYYYLSLKGIWYSLRAGVYIYDNYSKDISFWLSGGATKVNLWHGVGNKKINYDNKFDRVRHPKNKWERFCTFLRRLSDEKPYHYTLATSPVMATIFAGAFQTDLSHILVEGYPRNDSILATDESCCVYTEREEEARSLLGDLANQHKIFLYMPTFRDSELGFFDVIDLKRFNQYLVENNFVFVSKLHPKSKLLSTFDSIQLSNMITIKAEVDPYTILSFADVLITDYSSIYSDFMLLNRPVIGFYYDYEVYSKNTREGYFEFEEYMPEIKVQTMVDLEEAMRQVLIKDECEEKRLQSRERMFSNIDAYSSMRLTRKIADLIDLKIK